jgi:hypothetical protein
MTPLITESVKRRTVRLFEKDPKGNCRGQMECLYQLLFEETEENHEVSNLGLALP